MLVVAATHRFDEHPFRDPVGVGDQVSGVPQRDVLLGAPDQPGQLLLRITGTARCLRGVDVDAALRRGHVHRVLGLLDLLGELHRLQGLRQRADDLLVLLGLPVDHLHNRLVGRIEQSVLGGLVLQRCRGLRGCYRLRAGRGHHAAAHHRRVHATALRRVALRGLSATGGVFLRLLVVVSGPEPAGSRPATGLVQVLQVPVGFPVAVLGAGVQLADAALGGGTVGLGAGAEPAVQRVLVLLVLPGAEIALGLVRCRPELAGLTAAGLLLGTLLGIGVGLESDTTVIAVVIVGARRVVGVVRLAFGALAAIILRHPAAACRHTRRLLFSVVAALT